MSKKENDLNILRQFISDEKLKEIKHKLGKLLTQVDASIQDLEQRKALKDVIRNIFHDYDFDKYTDRSINEIIWQFAERNCPELIKDADRDYFEKNGYVKGSEENIPEVCRNRPQYFN